jgi:hypothetical protein
LKFSFSINRTFRTCQRKWFYSARFKSSRSKDGVRYEAYLLSKLQSVQAWRGNLVDYVIERRIVPALKNGWSLNLSQILSFARTVFDKQSHFALANRIREPGWSEQKDKESFAAFYNVEYCDGVSTAELAEAWREVELSLRNLLAMRELLRELGSATQLITQRTLFFPVDRIGVFAKPDLIAFFADAAPLIVDWKVHAYATQDYRLQLTMYAAALTRCEPHKDFPASLSNYQTTDVRLIEAQLLTNREREYALNDADVEELDTHIAVSTAEMILATGGSSSHLVPFDFPATSYPEACQRCQFRKLCWENPDAKEVLACQGLRQMSFL